MSDQYIEKSFIYLVVVSLLLHAGVFAALYYLPQSRQEPPKEPVFLDLQNMTELKQPTPPRQQETRRQSERRVRVPKETAPRGDSAHDNRTPPPQRQRPEQRTAPAFKPAAPQSSDRRQSQIAPGASVEGLLKPKAPSDNQSSRLQPQLFPGANRLARLEENYRRKFEDDIAEGDTRFLNSDDMLFGSFLRRFEGAVYGVWRYPQEAAMRGIEGITPVRITFNRRGEITNVEQLESSGARILDEEVARTLHSIGPIGGFPKGYRNDEFHLIAFFQYGGTRRSLR
ncbi:MAG: energy transducer TonB [Deltaproteobacteria bacterium]|nr:energy transducer TonB [Deltaproteobacteria bacterium]